MNNFNHIDLNNKKKIDEKISKLIDIRFNERQFIFKKNIQLSNKICKKYKCNDIIIRNGIVSLYSSLIYYLGYECPTGERTLSNVEMLLSLIDIRNDRHYRNSVDLIFEELGENQPNHIAVRYYNMFNRLSYKHKIKIVFMLNFFFYEMIIFKKIKE